MNSVPSTSSLESYLTLSSSSMTELVRILNETNFERQNEDWRLKARPVSAQSPRTHSLASPKSLGNDPEEVENVTHREGARTAGPFRKRLGALSHSLSGKASSFRHSFHSFGKSDQEDDSTSVEDEKSCHSKAQPTSAHEPESKRARNTRVHKSKEVQSKSTENNSKEGSECISEEPSHKNSTEQHEEETNMPVEEAKGRKSMESVGPEASPKERLTAQSSRKSKGSEKPSRRSSKLSKESQRKRKSTEARQNAQITKTQKEDEATHDSPRKSFEQHFTEDFKEGHLVTSEAARTSPLLQSENKMVESFPTIEHTKERASLPTRKSQELPKRTSESSVVNDLKKKANANIRSKPEKTKEIAEKKVADIALKNSKKKSKFAISRGGSHKQDECEPENQLVPQTSASVPVQEVYAENQGSANSSWVRRSSTAFSSRGQKYKNSLIPSLPSLTKLSSMFHPAAGMEEPNGEESAFSPKEISSSQEAQNSLFRLVPTKTNNPRAAGIESRKPEQSPTESHWKTKLKKSFFRSKKSASKKQEIVV